MGLFSSTFEMQNRRFSFKDNKRAATAMEDGRGSSSTQPGSEDAPVYCKRSQILLHSWVH